jgi:hypothetical protein
VVERIQAHRPIADHPDLGLAVQPGDAGGVVAQQLGGEVPQRAHHLGLDQVDLAPEEALARLDLGGLRVPISGRAALQDVGDEHLPPLQADLAQQAVEELAGLADEGQAHPVLVGAGRLADEHQVGVRVARPEHHVGARLRQRAAPAVARLFEVDRLQRLAALGSRRHATDRSPAG